MDHKEYNGWHNYATWRVALEMFDNRGNTKDLLDGVLHEYSIKSYSLGERRKGSCAYHDDLKAVTEWCQTYVEDYFHQIAQSDNDLLLHFSLAFLDDVYWREIATHFLDELIDELQWESNTATNEEVQA
jgi:hypothetical protein